METTLSAPQLSAAVAADYLHLRIPSQPEWIAPTVELLKDRALACGACQESRARKLVIALHEALTNAVVHGNLELSSNLKERADNSFAEALAARAADPCLANRPVDIQMDYDGERCQWTITDQGPGFDYESILHNPVEEGPEMFLASGRGILLMRALLDEMWYECDGRRLCLTLHRSSGVEKRQHPRLPVRRNVQVAPIRPDGSVDWQAAYQAVSSNLSRGGLSLLQNRLAATERILIGLEEDGQVLYVPAEIRHCQKVGDNVMELGCRFATRMQAWNGTDDEAPSPALEEAVGRLLDRLQNGQTQFLEQRIYPRVVYTERIAIASESNANRTQGFARNLSRSGIAFLTTLPLPLERTLLLLPRGDGSALHVHAEIVRCVKFMDGVYDTAARFLTLAAEVSLG